MSATCGKSAINAIEGVCGRPGYIVDNSDCGNDQNQCNAKYGKDGSRWCASDGYGCCMRKTFAECGNDLCPWSPGCQEIVGQHCMDPANVTSPLCQSFCSVINNKRFCDTAMETYCTTSAGQADPLCSCINAVARGSPIPGCFDAMCSASGYKNFDQATQAQQCPSFCGSILECRGAGTCTIDDNTIVTHCFRQQQQQAALDQTAAGSKMALPVIVIIIAVVVLVIFGFFFAS